MIREQAQFAANFTLPPVLLSSPAYRIVAALVGHPVGVLAAANDGAAFHGSGDN